MGLVCRGSEHVLTWAEEAMQHSYNDGPGVSRIGTNLTEKFKKELFGKSPDSLQTFVTTMGLAGRFVEGTGEIISPVPCSDRGGGGSRIGTIGGNTVLPPIIELERWAWLDEDRKPGKTFDNVQGLDEVQRWAWCAEEWNFVANWQHLARQ